MEHPLLTRTPRDPLPLRLARRLGLARGVFRNEGLGPRPALPLELYAYEGCPHCRRVRQTLTELDLDFLHRSTPRGPSPKRDALRERGGKVQVPFLVDPNTQKISRLTQDQGDNRGNNRNRNDNP